MNVPPLLHKRAELFVTCAPGIEPILHAEIAALGFARVERQVGGVRCEGTWRDALRAHLELRTAVRVLVRVARFDAANESELERGVQAVDWSGWMTSTGTLRVDAKSSQSALDHTLYVEQRTKDAICDQFKAATGERPSVHLDAPDLMVNVHLYRDRCTLSVDLSGESLHKRGWRRYQGRAPLAETLAAAQILASGWDRRAPLLDPFCGSGTLLVEAALIAANVAPGVFREQFGFQRLPFHDEAAWQALRAETRKRERWPNKLTLWGADSDRHAIEGAHENLAAAGLSERVQLHEARAEEFAPRRGWNGWITSNLPYGERVGDERALRGTFSQFGARLREHASGYAWAFLSGNEGLEASLGLSPERVWEWKNGALDCRLLVGRMA